ncbi:MAG TPA: 50S ribosomal protein L15 [Rickettsiales bacterium]|nr:50S ribosomal protein L15 [Rickettsiales bacterium]
MLNKLAKIKTQGPKRVGRGIGSGKGKTSGRGVKGQKARTGHHSVKGFEGGQTPIYMRLPKKGFTNVLRKEYQVVSIKDIAALIASKKIAEGEINKETLQKAGLIKDAKAVVKLIMANKEVAMPKVKILVDKYSAKAKDFA